MKTVNIANLFITKKIRMEEKREMPLGKLFSQLAKDYVGSFTQRLGGLPISRYFYPLLLIDEANGKLSQQALANGLNVDKVAVVRMVDYLEENGLVARQKNPEDRREQLLLITPAGRKLVPQIRQAMAETNDLSLHAFSEKEVGQLEKLLSRVICNLKKQPQDSYHVEFIKNEN